MAQQSSPLRSWLLVLVAAVTASFAFDRLALPSPVLFGSLAAGMLHALTARQELEMPPVAFRVGQGLVGAVIGALVQPSTLVRIAADWPSVLLAMPIVLQVFFDAGGAGAGTSPGPVTRWLPDLTFVVLAVGAGLLLQRLVTAPATALLGPLAVAVVLSASGVLGDVSVPTALENLGYALIGVRVGLRFTRASLRSIARLLPLACGLIVAVIVACGLLGLLLTRFTGVDPLTAYLATTPGGLFAVLATAADSGSDVTYVLAVQVIRVVVMLVMAPLLGLVLRR